MELSGITLGARLGPSRIGSGLGGWKGLSGPITVDGTEDDADGGRRMLDDRLGPAREIVLASDAARLCAFLPTGAATAFIISYQSVEEGTDDTLDALPDTLDALLDTLDALLDALPSADNAPGTAMASITPQGPEEAADDTRHALLDGMWCPGASGTSSA